MEERYITKEDNPCYKVGWLKQPKTVIHTINDEEIGKMILSSKPTCWMNMRNKMMLFFADTGIRASELIDIEHADIFETTIRIKGKGDKQRYVPIFPILKKNMIKYERMKEFYFKYKLLTHSNYFVSYRSLPLTPEALLSVVKIAGISANVRKSIRCSPHTIRHYYAQKQLRLGIDIYSLSRLLGHETVNITKVYLESIGDESIVETGRIHSPLMNMNNK
jgi:integrase/recombinase XerD